MLILVLGAAWILRVAVNGADGLKNGSCSMDLHKELDRLTEPAPAASAVRVLTPGERNRLMKRGEITPIEQIHNVYRRSRVSFPRDWSRGVYGFGR